MAVSAVAHVRAIIEIMKNLDFPMTSKQSSIL